MKHFKSAVVLFSGLVLILAQGCNKDKIQKDIASINISTDTVMLNLKHYWGLNKFQMLTNLTHANGDVVLFDTMRYYISNVKLRNADGSWFTQPDSYFLVNLLDSNSTKIAINDVPFGVYTGISFMLGIDSTQQDATSNLDALSAAKKMTVIKDSGYYLIQANGTADNAPNDYFFYSLHGEKGKYSLMKDVFYGFDGPPMRIFKESSYGINVNAYVDQLWKSIESVAEIPEIKYYGPFAKLMANDYFSSFAFSSFYVD